MNKILIEELSSPNEAARFDALAIIGEFRVPAALPALRLLSARLQHESSPGAPFEVAKVNRIIDRLKKES